MKKIFALILALSMALALCACGSSNSNTAEEKPSAEATELRVAMISDYIDITDQSYNQTTYEACKAYCEPNGIDFKYFKPSTTADSDRVNAMEQAIDEDYNVIVVPGYAFGAALEEVVPENPEVSFIALDVSANDIGSLADNIPSNLYCAVYREELCGYMAGYAAVKLGYTELGFLGGVAVPAVVHYGYGFIQGADDAAVELGLEDVSIKYVYANQFFGDPDITAYMDSWFHNNTELVFACGGTVFDSVGEVASKLGGKIIGVDTDQAAIIDAHYGEGITVTSATKGLGATVNAALTALVNGSFEGGKVEVLGVTSDVPSENFVQLAPSTRFNDKFSKADYEALVKAINAGKEISGDITVQPQTTIVKVDMQGNIK